MVADLRRDYQAMSGMILRCGFTVNDVLAASLSLLSLPAFGITQPSNSIEIRTRNPIRVGMMRRRRCVRASRILFDEPFKNGLQRLCCDFVPSQRSRDGFKSCRHSHKLCQRICFHFSHDWRGNHRSEETAWKNRSGISNTQYRLAVRADFRKRSQLKFRHFLLYPAALRA